MGGRAGSFTRRMRSIAAGRAPRDVGAAAAKDAVVYDEAQQANVALRKLARKI